MLKLYGIALSNHYNKVKLALLEKGLQFEEVAAPPSQEENVLQRSPMGKVPWIDVDGKTLCETTAINEYLEDAYPNPPLYPRDPWQRAKCRELNQLLELNVLLPAFRLLPAAFFGATASDEKKNDVLADVERGIKAVARRAKFDPYIMGKDFTFTDCSAFNHLQVVAMIGNIIFGKDPTAGLPGCADYIERVKQHPAAQKVVADRDKAFAAFMASKK
jgi:glutathione S-transferase